LMKNALKKFLDQVGDSATRAPSYPSDSQKKHEEKEQMDQPQEEFIDPKSVDTKEARPRKNAPR
jgi:hypothetical protein